MPFVRFARDKRGYEHIYLVHESVHRGKPSRPRVLYWYRTPPGVKVGRPPFDDEARREIETRNPGVAFDWAAITSAQPPPPDAEHWRERRQAEKTAKLARIAEEGAAATDQAGIENPAAEPIESDIAEPSAVEPAAEPSAAEPLHLAHKRRRRRGGRRRRGANDGPISTSPPETASEEPSPGLPPESIPETSEE